jgi:hypothetical protein
MYKVAAYFDVGTVDNGKLRPELLDKGNESRHLRVI